MLLPASAGAPPRARWGRGPAPPLSLAANTSGPNPPSGGFGRPLWASTSAGSEHHGGSGGFDRMPVLLEPHEYERWLHGTIKEVIAFQFRPPPPSDRFTIEHTDDLWRSGKLPPTAQPQASLL